MINNIKKKLDDNSDDVIVIDDFDPWVFGTQEALLISMYDMILQHTGIKFSVYQNRNIAKKLSATIANVSSLLTSVSEIRAFFSILSTNRDAYNNINTLKEEMITYLKANNKTILFIIDNIDRAEANNIIFLFKLIATIFDLPNLIYILSYDKGRIEDILNDTKKINPKYLEKIIQQEIHVPTVQKNQIHNLYGKCIENILKTYEVKSDEIKLYIPIYKVICTKVNDLRNFKRLINATFPPVFTIDHKLNKFNLLAIEVIRFLEPALYESIRVNSKYFISHHKEYNEEAYASAFNREEFNTKGKQYFDDLFEVYPFYKQVLSSLFPYVKRYRRNNELIPKYTYEDGDMKNIEKQMSICSAKYFDLYFSYGDNEFFFLGTKTQELFAIIKAKKSTKTVYDSFCYLLNNIDPDNHKVWLEGVQQYLDDISSEYTTTLALAVWDNISKINDSKQFLGLSARERATFIISILIEKSKLEEVKTFSKAIYKDLNKLKYISRIIYWLENSKSDNQVKERKNIICQTYEKLCQEIIKNRINLYEEPNYSWHNIWGLFHFYKEREDKDVILSKYINDIFSPKFVYRYIGDIILHSVGTNGYGYQIDSESFSALYFDESTIDSALKNHPPKTDSEKFILEVYQKYKSGEKNIYGEKGMNSPTEIKLEL